MSKRILVLDDEENIRNDLKQFLQDLDYHVFESSSISQMKTIILSEEIDFAIVDLKIDFKSEYGGINAINYIKRIQPKTKTIILSAYQLNPDILSKLEFEHDGYVDKGGHENYISAVIKKIDILSKKEKIKSCFVIMPFSKTKSCSKEEWTEIFQKLIKPAVEESGFNYICRRSEAEFGNIIDGILKELNQADVVIADLTDQNPNVFYELGVRQALRDATIQIAQRLEDIPFDLRHQATHVYDWKLEEKRIKFKSKIKKLLEIIENNPDEAKSPVKDYLSLD